MSTRKVLAACPICKESLNVDIDVNLIEKASNYPVSVVVEHGKPTHLMILYIDAQFRVRGVEGHTIKLTEEAKQDVIDIALEEKRSLKRLAEIPELLDDLKMIVGIEFVDSNGVAVMSLSRAGLSIGPIMSPSGRLKARVIIANEGLKDTLTPIMQTTLNSLEDATPLSPVTLALVLRVVEECVETNCELDPVLLKDAAQSIIILPTKTLKQNVFNVMTQHTLDEETGIKEIQLITDRLDGNTTLLTLLNLIKKKGLSMVKLLRGLEKLREAEALVFSERDEALMR